MAGVGSWLVALAGPIARQVLVSLGIGVITFVGLDTGVSAALASAKSNLTGMSVDVASVVALGGGFTALSVIAGGITAGISMIALKRFAKL